MGLLKRIVIFILAAVAVAAGVWLLGSRLMGAPQSKENSVRWPFGLGTIDEVPARFPKSSNDATAEHVKGIARRINSTDQMLRAALQAYVAKQIGRGDDGVDAPPLAIRQFLDGHIAAIDELRTALSNGDPPRWATDVDQQSHETTLDLTTHMWLFRVLAADACDHHTRGDDTTAWRDMETGWTLAQGLWAQPDLIMRLIALSGTRIVNSVATKLSTPAPAWYERLLAFDAGHALIPAMQFEAWRMLTSQDRVSAPRSRDDDPPDMWRRSAVAILHTVNAPRAAKYAASLRVAAEAMTQSHPCGDVQSTRSKAFSDPAGAANAVLARLKRFYIEREAAAKLLALKEQRHRSGEWPEAMPDIGKSVCGENAWRYRREVDGSMSLSFVIPLTQDVSGVLPLSFRYPK